MYGVLRQPKDIVQGELLSHVTAVVYAAALVPISLFPWLIGTTGLWYVAAAAPLGVGFVWLAVRFATVRSNVAARALFLGSIVYLPILWIAMIVNRS